MSRDDSDLYTGLSSKAFTRVKTEKKLRRDDTDGKRTEALKNGQLIIEQLNKDEADLTSRVFNLIDNSDKEEDVRAKLLALRMERERIVLHRATFERLLRPKGDTK